MNKLDSYTIKVFVAGMPGYYKYNVGVDYDQAIDHFSNIIRDGYRRVNDRGQMVQHMPITIQKVILEGPNIETKYPDEIVST